VRLSRRTFLLVLAGAVPAAAAGALWSRRDADEPRADTFAGRATSFVDDLDAARRLGRTYLDEHPDEAGEARLQRLLLQSSPGWSRAQEAAVDPEVLRTLARREARRDYAAGRVVSVSGWYLSRTEARLAALALYA
jgi:hypothetical protein